MQALIDDSSLILEPRKRKEMFSVTQDKVSGIYKVRINFSSLSIIQECAKKAEYLLLRSLRPNTEAPATIFGQAIHKALEAYYLAPRTKRNLPIGYAEAMKIIGIGGWNSSFEEDAIFLAAKAFYVAAEPLVSLPPEDKRSIKSGIWTLTHYFENYSQDPYVILNDDKGPIVERNFSYALGEYVFGRDIFNIELFGQIDCAFKNEETQEVLIADHKTTSRISSFHNASRPNHQYTAYILGARKCLGINIDKLLINAIEVKAIPKTSRGSGPQFFRQITDRDNGDFDDLEHTIIQSVKTFVSLKKENYFPMSAPGACAKYSGCQYLDVCSSPEKLREEIIKMKYQEIV
jgi:hypothetical protein